MAQGGTIVAGQRWASEAEPELGLGVVLSCEFGRIELAFPAADERRLFALSSAPLRRVSFGVGDRIETREGRQWQVDEVCESQGLLAYRVGDRTISERDLADTIRFSKPEERLFAGLVDDLTAFRLRVEALAQRAALRRSPARGFLGARIDLLPHQIATAESIAARSQPRD